MTTTIFLKRYLVRGLLRPFLVSNVQRHRVSNARHDSKVHHFYQRRLNLTRWSTLILDFRLAWNDCWGFRLLLVQICDHSEFVVPWPLLLMFNEIAHESIDSTLRSADYSGSNITIWMQSIMIDLDSVVHKDIAWYFAIGRRSCDYLRPITGLISLLSEADTVRHSGKQTQSESQYEEDSWVSGPAYIRPRRWYRAYWRFSFHDSILMLVSMTDHF